jgi:hypothetical protein
MGKISPEQESASNQPTSFVELTIATVAFFIAIMILALIVSSIGNAVGSGGSFPLLTVEKTSIGFGALGVIALVGGVSSSIVIIKRRVVVVRGWVVLVGLLLTLLVIHSSAKVSGGELDIPSAFQFGAMLIAFVAFWLGFYGDEREIGMQSCIVFAALSVLYWGWTFRPFRT